VAREQVTRWAARYGSRVTLLLAFAVRSPDRPLRHQSDYTVNELRWLIINEQVELPEDLLVRRTSLAIAGLLTPELVKEITALLGAERGWDSRQAQGNLRLTFERLAGYHGLSALAESVIEDPFDVSES